MNEPAGNIRPDWVSDEMYPFESRFFHTPDGHEMHYVDEGAGAPIVFVHGNPSWSFEFRHLIRGLRSDFHCVAPDHIGFGLSSRSERWEDYHPKAHAERLAALLEQLDLREITLFLVDWGGPIGLDFARKRPERVKRIVIANTWCWPVADDRYYVMFSAFMSSWIGQLFIQRFNMFVNQVMPMAVGNKGCLTAPVLEHYRQAQPTPQARRISWGRRIGWRASGVSGRNSRGSRRSYFGASKTLRFGRRNSGGGNPSCRITSYTNSGTADISWRKRRRSGCCQHCAHSWKRAVAESAAQNAVGIQRAAGAIGREGMRQREAAGGD